MPALVVTAPSESRRLIRRRRWNLTRGIMALFTVFAIGAVGFKVIEGDSWSWLDSTYMAVITMSTVGFEEVRPLSESGRIFAMVIIVTGVGAFAYTFATLGEQLISGQLVSNLRQRGTDAMMRRMRGHHIVVGYGDTGSVVAAELNSLRKTRVVVIDTDGEKVRNASEDGFVGIHGDGAGRGVDQGGYHEGREFDLYRLAGFGGIDDGVDGARNRARSLDRSQGNASGIGGEAGVCRCVEGDFDASHRGESDRGRDIGCHRGR